MSALILYAVLIAVLLFIAAAVYLLVFRDAEIAEELQLHEQDTMPELQTLYEGHAAACVICGCDDFHACVDDEEALWIDANPCYWLRVDRELRMGICSRHPESVEAWDRGEFHPGVLHAAGHA